MVHVIATNLVIYSQLLKITLLVDSNVLTACHVLVISYTEADHAFANMNELPMFPNNLWMSCLRQDISSA